MIPHSVGSGVVLGHKKLDAGKFELPKATREGEQHIIVSGAIFDVTLVRVGRLEYLDPREVHGPRQVRAS